MREFLKGLELDKETIDTIMAEHGKLITEAKEENLDLRNQIQNYEAQINEYKTQLEENSKNLENLQNLTNENKDLKAQVQMDGSNVKKEFNKFVRSEVLSQVDDEHDFASVLESYKKENPQYFGDTVVKKVQSSPTLNGGNPQVQTTNETMNNLIRSAVNDN